MLRLLLSISLFLTNAQTIETYTSSSSYSVSCSPSASYSPSSSPSPLASVSYSVSSSSLASYSSSPLASSIPPTNTPTNNNKLGYIMVGCTLGALMIIGTITGIHAVLTKRYKNTKLVSRANTANTNNTFNKIHQTSVRTLLPSQKILNYTDNSDSRIVFPPVNNV